MRRAILFDIDGTLLDAWDFVMEAMRNSLSLHSHPQPSAKEIQKSLGKSLGKSLTEFYKVLIPEGDPVKLANTHHEFQKENFHLIKPFPKTKKILKSLKDSGFLLAAVSNRMRESLLHSLKLAEIFDYFDVIVSADDVDNPKPHQDHLLVALKKLEVEPINAYVVGDTDQDILAGKNARVKTIGVTYGFLGKDIKKHQPDYLIDNIEELLDIVN